MSTIRCAGNEPAVQGLADIGEALMRDVGPVLDSFVARMRNESTGPGARVLRFSQLADHMPSLVADIAETLVVIEESRGEPSSIIADGTAIRRMISERHGVQRARSGGRWMRSVRSTRCCARKSRVQFTAVFLVSARVV